MVMITARLSDTRTRIKDFSGFGRPATATDMARAARRLVQGWRTVFALVAAAAILSGCAVQLAPDYDRTIVGGLSTANEQTMIMFATVSQEPSKASFGKNEKTYNALIGQFDALRLQAKSRPTPRPAFLQFIGGGGDPNKKPDQIEILKSPTPEILNTIAKTLVKMRDRHKATGLTTTVVTGFKQSYEISIDQALTYEKALER